MRTSLKRLAMGVAIPLIGLGGFVAMSAPSYAATSVTVTPNTNITPGEKVTVSASGFTPKASLAIVECSPRATLPGVNQQNECDLGALAFATADASGNMAATSFTVPTAFAAADKLAVCPPNPNTQYCGIAVANIAKTSENGFEAIIYAGQPLPTTTTTAPGQTTTTAAGVTTTTAGQTTTTAAAGVTTTTAASHVLATTATNSGTLPLTGSGRRLLGLAILGVGFVILGFALTAGGRRARRRGFRA